MKKTKNPWNMTDPRPPVIQSGPPAGEPVPELPAGITEPPDLLL